MYPILNNPVLSADLFIFTSFRVAVYCGENPSFAAEVTTALERFTNNACDGYFFAGESYILPVYNTSEPIYIQPSEDGSSVYVAFCEEI